MKADERIGDVIGALQVEDEPCRCVQHRLESAQDVGCDADQHAVTGPCPNTVVSSEALAVQLLSRK